MLWRDRGCSVRNCVINPIIQVYWNTQEHKEMTIHLPYLRGLQHLLPSYSKKQTKPKCITWVFFFTPHPLSHRTDFRSADKLYFQFLYLCLFLLLPLKKTTIIFVIALTALKIDVLLTFLFPHLHAFSEQPVTFTKCKLGPAYHTCTTLKIEGNWNPLWFRFLPYPSFLYPKASYPSPTFFSGSLQYQYTCGLLYLIFPLPWTFFPSAVHVRTCHFPKMFLSCPRKAALVLLMCVFVCMCVLVTQSCVTLCAPWTIACQAALSMESLRQEYWSGLPLPSQGIFPTQGLNLGLLHCRRILYHMSNTV